MRDEEFDRRVADARRASELTRAARQSSVSSAEEAARRDWQASLAAARAAVLQLRRHGVPLRPADVELSGGTYRRGMFGGYKFTTTSSYSQSGGTIRERRWPEHWVVPLPGIVKHTEDGKFTESVMLTPEAELGFMDQNPSRTIRLDLVNTVAVYEFAPLSIALMPNGEWWVERRAPWRQFGSYVCRAAELPTAIEAGVIAVAAGA